MASELRDLWKLRPSSGLRRERNLRAWSGGEAEASLHIARMWMKAI